MQASNRPRRSFVVVLAGFVAGGLLAVVSLSRVMAADVPPVSTFAPAADVEAQLTKFLGELEAGVADEAAFKDLAEGKVERDSNTIILMALALGLHDQESKYKAHAGAMIDAAQALAVAKDYAATKKAFDALKAASESGSKDGALQWSKVASLPALMKEVPLLNTKLTKAIDKKKLKDACGPSAVIAVIAQGAMANSGDTKKPTESAKWIEYSVNMRKAAAAVNAAVHAGDQKAANKAAIVLKESCEECHKVFKPEEK